MPLAVGDVVRTRNICLRRCVLAEFVLEIENAVAEIEQKEVVRIVRRRVEKDAVMIARTQLEADIVETLLLSLLSQV